LSKIRANASAACARPGRASEANPLIFLLKREHLKVDEDVRFHRIKRRQ